MKGRLREISWDRITKEKMVEYEDKAFHEFKPWTDPYF